MKIYLFNKKLILFSIFILLICKIYSQSREKNDSIFLETLPEYKINNDIIYFMMDSFLNNSKSCLFVEIGKPTYITICISISNDSIFFSFMHAQNNQLSFDKQLDFIKYEGFFYYNNYLVLIIADKPLLDSFFIKQRDKIDIKYVTESPLKSSGNLFTTNRFEFLYTNGKIEKTWENKCKNFGFISSSILNKKSLDSFCSINQIDKKVIKYMDDKYYGYRPYKNEIIICYYRDKNGEIIVKRVSQINEVLLLKKGILDY